MTSVFFLFHQTRLRSFRRSARSEVVVFFSSMVAAAYHLGLVQAVFVRTDVKALVRDVQKW